MVSLLARVVVRVVAFSSASLWLWVVYIVVSMTMVMMRGVEWHSRGVWTGICICRCEVGEREKSVTMMLRRRVIMCVRIDHCVSGRIRCVGCESVHR